MLDTGRKEPSWILIVFALGLIGVMYVYDRTVAQKAHGARQYADMNSYRGQFDNPLRECGQASGGDDQRRCTELVVGRGLESKGSSCGPMPTAGSSESTVF
jgi:hypothetical protein